MSHVTNRPNVSKGKSLVLAFFLAGALLQTPVSATAAPALCSNISGITLAGGGGGFVNAGQTLTATPVTTDPTPCTPDSATYSWRYLAPPSSFVNSSSGTAISGVTTENYAPTDGSGGSLNLVGNNIRLRFSYKPDGGSTIVTLVSNVVTVYPANVVVPSFSDPTNPVTLSVDGNTLTATSNGVIGTPTPVPSYRWWSCTDNSQALYDLLDPVEESIETGGETCEVIVGAETSTYVVTGLELGVFFIPEITETNSDGPTVYGAVTGYELSLPTVTAPAFTGNAWEGSTLTQSETSTATGYPLPTVTYSWQTSSDAGATWSPVGSAETYTVKAADRSNASQMQIKLVATASNGGSRTATDSSSAANTYTAPNATGGSVVAGGGNFTAPVSFKVGQTVYGLPWQVMGTPWPTLTYQWYICDSPNSASLAGCEASGESGTADQSTNYAFSFTIPVEAAGKYLTFSASLANAATTFNLTQSRIMRSRIIYSVLALTSDPVISGTKVVGQTLSASAPATTSLPAPKITYQWLSADPATGSYGPIPGAKKNTFKLQAAQRGKFIKFAATATLPMNDSVTVTSAATEVILSNQAAVSITNTSTQRRGLAGTPITVTVGGGTGGGAVTIASVTEGCTIVDMTIVRSLSTGTCSVVATRAANDSYLSASSTAVTFTFNAIAQSPALSISNTPTTNIAKGTNISLTTAGGAGDGAVTYAVTPTPDCELTGNVLTVAPSTNPGLAVKCTVTATKAAFGIYKAAKAKVVFGFRR